MRVGEESAVTTDRAGQENTPVFCHSICNQCSIQCFLCAIHPNQLPSQVANRERVVMFHTESSGVIECAVTNHDDHRNTQRRGNRQSLHGIHPAHATTAAEDASAAS